MKISDIPADLYKKKVCYRKKILFFNVINEMRFRNGVEF